MWIADGSLIADGGPWMIAGEFCASFVGGIVSIVVFVLTRRGEKVDRLEGSLDATTKALIGAEITIHSGALKASIDRLAEQVHQINRRLDDGDQHLDGLVQSDHKLELKTASKLSELREWVMNTSATKEDVRGLHEKMDVLHRAVSAGLISRIEGAAERIGAAAEKIDHTG